MKFSPKGHFMGLVILSTLAHILILSQFNWKAVAKPPREKLIEVDLLPPEIVEEKKKFPPDKTQKKQASPQKNTVKSVRSKSNKLPENPQKNRAIVVKKTTKTITPPRPIVVIKPKIKSSLSIRSNLASRNTRETGPIAISTDNIEKRKVEVSIRSFKDLDFVPDYERALGPKTEVVLRRFDAPSLKGVEAGQITPGKTPIVIDGQMLRKSEETEKFDQIREDLPRKGEEGSTESTEPGNIFIEGEASKRKILFRPQPPELDIERDVTISLRFTVLPDGSVDKILPYTKAEIQLESLAIDLLQQYKFKPLFGSDLQQSGIIHFTIYRKK